MDGTSGTWAVRVVARSDGMALPQVHSSLRLPWLFSELGRDPWLQPTAVLAALSIPEVSLEFLGLLQSQEFSM